MNVLMLAKTDWANLGSSYSEGLKSVGVNSVILVANRHNFKYPKKGSKHCCPRKMIPYCKNAAIIQFMHSEYINVGPLIGKRIFVIHGGSKYRQNPRKYNSIFNPIVEKTIIQTGDLLGLGAKNEVWVLPPIDTERIKPIYNINEEKIIIAHHPDHVTTKGTRVINKVMKSINRDSYNRNKIHYVYSPKIVRWKNNIKRISQCDIYIEALNLKQGNKKYGEWGITCLEAAALGKIVITHFLSLKRYEKEYGKCPLMVANNPDQLKNVLKKLIAMDKGQLLKIKKETRRWVEKLHSYKAVGKRLKEKVYGI